MTLPIEDDFIAFCDMGVENIDAPSHVDDFTVDPTLIPARTEPCPNPDCSAHAAILYAVELGKEFRQCVVGCGVFMVVE